MRAESNILISYRRRVCCHSCGRRYVVAATDHCTACGVKLVPYQRPWDQESAPPVLSRFEMAVGLTV